MCWCDGRRTCANALWQRRRHCESSRKNLRADPHVKTTWREYRSWRTPWRRHNESSSELSVCCLCVCVLKTGVLACPEKTS